MDFEARCDIANAKPPTDAMDITLSDARSQEAAEFLRLREESFRRSDTDGFLTQWAHGLTAQQHRAQAEIDRNGGQALFPGLYTADGSTRIPAKLIETRFGQSWALCDERGKFRGVFVNFRGSHLEIDPDNYNPDEPSDVAALKRARKGLERRRANLAKQGYRERAEWAPAKARCVGTGTGLSGNAWIAVVRMDGGYPGCPL